MNVRNLSTPCDGMQTSWTEVHLCLQDDAGRLLSFLIATDLSHVVLDILKDVKCLLLSRCSLWGDTHKSNDISLPPTASLCTEYSGDYIPSGGLLITHTHHELHVDMNLGECSLTHTHAGKLTHVRKHSPVGTHTDSTRYQHAHILHFHLPSNTTVSNMYTNIPGFMPNVCY